MVVNFRTKRKRVCDFLLVIISNLGHILHRFWDTTTWPKIANFPYPTLIKPPCSGWTLKPFRISGRACKISRSMSLSYPTVKMLWSQELRRRFLDTIPTSHVWRPADRRGETSRRRHRALQCIEKTAPWHRALYQNYSRGQISNLMRS